MAATILRTYRLDGLEHVAVENADLRAVFIPELGCKMTELRNLRTGSQFLLAPQSVGGRYRRASYGADFADFDTSGFDECFPAVAAGPYRSLSAPDRETNVKLPDHGELWSRPWTYRAEGEEAVFSIDGVVAPYRFEKRVRLAGNVLVSSYTVRNGSPEPFTFLWSAHPLLHVRPGSRLLLPEEIDTVFLNWSSDDLVGKFGDRVPWPCLNPSDRARNFGIVQERSLGVAVKAFTDVLHEGFAGIYDSAANESLMLEFDPQRVPYLGLWLCYGGWPVGVNHRHLTVALEPCTGRPDALDQAVQRGECVELAPEEEYRWTLSLSVWKGLPPARGQNENLSKSPIHHQSPKPL
jgi:galactose mutarotase-like enzyme